MPFLHTIANAVLFLATEAEGEGGAHAEEPNPILPEVNEIIWGGIAFFVLLILLNKYAMPAIQKSLKAREDRIRSDLEAAEQAKAEAERVREQYQQQLADARNEAGRIIEAARQSADEVKRDLHSRAEAEAAELRARAQADIDATVAQARADLQRQVADFAVSLAERVVEQSIDRQAQQALIDRYIEQVGAMGSPSGARGVPEGTGSRN